MSAARNIHGEVMRRAKRGVESDERSEECRGSDEHSEELGRECDERSEERCG